MYKLKYERSNIKWQKEFEQILGRKNVRLQFNRLNEIDGISNR